MEFGSIQLHCFFMEIHWACVSDDSCSDCSWYFFSLCVTTGFAYALSDTTLPGHRILNFMCVFTMLFSGGIVASYYTWSQIFHIRNTMWALVFPGLMMNAFNVILVKNYFRFSVPASLIEAALDVGQGKLRFFSGLCFLFPHRS